MDIPPVQAAVVVLPVSGRPQFGDLGVLEACKGQDSRRISQHVKRDVMEDDDAHLGIACSMAGDLRSHLRLLG